MGNIDRRVIREKNFESDDMKRVQRDCIECTTTNTDGLLENYLQMEESHNGRYINSDLMKMLFDIYAESMENRNKYNLAVTNSAACLANEYYTRQVQNPDIKRCVYIAGPYGAGKSFFAQSLFVAGAIPEDTIVYEGSITFPAFGEKVKAAIGNNVTPEIVVLNPTLELSMRNIRLRAAETGRDVIKSEVVHKYADMYSDINNLFGQLRDEFEEYKDMEYPLSIQIYNKTSNVPSDLSVSYNLEDLKNGSREEISNQYDLIKQKLDREEKTIEER